MKRILFIAPHSFPVSSSESICNSKVAFSLAKSGYMVDVYTCVDPYSYPQASNLDKELKNSDNLRIFSVPKRDIIKRSGGSLKAQLRAVIRHLFILFKSGYFYNGITLPYDIIQTIKKNTRGCKDFPYDVMITRGFRTDYVGIYFAKKTGIKWIANWNDPYPEDKFPSPYGKGNEAKLHFFKNLVFNDVQKYATIHTFPNSRLRDYMLTCFRQVSKEQTYVIPHMALSTLSPDNHHKDNNVLSIVSCGNVKKPRSLDLFLQSLSIVLSQQEFHDIRIQCDFIGTFDQDSQEKIEQYNLSERVRLLPPKPYDECIDIINRASVSLIIEAVCEEGIYLPTKLVDAVQCGTPVLCISPRPGVLQDIVNKYDIGYYAYNADVKSIVEALKAVFSDFKKQQLPVITKNTAPVFFEDSILKLYKQLL